MGVPGFFAWILRKFRNKILLPQLPSNPEYLYIDANCLFHPECFKILDYFIDETNVDTLEDKMFRRIINYLDYLENFIQPKQMMYISVDGTAPLAKIGQQRKRRFKSIMDIKMKNDIKLKHNIRFNECWNNTVITPGTEFMEKLHRRLYDHYNRKKTKINYILSSYHTSGEGEHKILQHIKKHTKNGEPIVVYGLDADLIFLTMASRRNNIYLLREETHFGKAPDVELLDPVTDVAQHLIFVSINETKRAYNSEIVRMIENNRNINVKVNDDINFADDLIFICFLLGNDFLPHFPSIDIHRGGLDMLIDCYIMALAEYQQLMISFDNNDVPKIEMPMFKYLIKKLGEKEERHFKYEMENHIRNKERRKCFANDPYSIEVWEMENLRNITVDDPVKLGSDSADLWKFRYYEHYFKTSEHQKQFVDNLCYLYLEGMMWVTKYYFEQCDDWLWQFPYDYAPFISDIGSFLEISNINMNDIKFDKRNPIPTMVQLTSVLPPQCYNILPKDYQQLTTNDKSPIIDMFPKKISIDFLYKDQYWQGIPRVPYLDIERIIDAIKNKKMSKDELKRSELLNDFKF